MKQAEPEELRGILAQNRAAALAYAHQVGTGNVRELLSLAESDLLERIDALKMTGTFTEAHLRTMLVQVRLVTSQLVDNITGTLADNADPMASMAAQGTLDYMTGADAMFRGVGVQPLAIREASVVDSARVGARASLLRRLALGGTADDPTADPQAHPGQMGVMQRYGMGTIGEFEKILRAGLLTRKGIDEVKGDLTKASPFLQGKPAFWGERIARTEMMGAYNRASWESQREVNEQLDGEMVKILSATFDDRTAADSYAVHGQIRRTDEAFETWYGLMQHPPARPNDREIVVPHRISWEIPRYLRWKTDGDVVARWHWEGRKGSPPERPEMTTVDLGKFGKEPEKKKDEEGEEIEPGPGMRDVMGQGALADQLGEDALQQYGPDPENAPNVGLDFDAQQQLLDAQAAEAAKQAQVDELLGSFPENPARPGSVKHGLPFVNQMFWHGWTGAEQDLISTLSDALVEKDKTQDVDTEDIVLKGDSANKIGVKYGIEDNLSGMAQTPVLIKKDGVHYVYTSPGDVVANKALGNAKLDAHVLDLDDQAIADQFPSLKGPPPPKVLTGADIMAKKTGDKKGSNEGGFYLGADGVERYVKVYKDPAQAHCENIANSIYRALGLSAPESTTFDKDGKTHYAHPTVPGQTLDKAGLDKKTASKILDGFAADILLGNRDVIGASKDNILITPDGSVRRIDNGGSLLMRAQAGRKPTEDLHQIKEWDGFFNSNVNTYAGVLDAAGVKTHADMKKQLSAGIKAITKLRDEAGGWAKFIDRTAPTMSDKDRHDVAQMLETRSKLLEEKLKILNKRVPKPKPVVLEPGKWGPAQTTSYEELLAQKKPAAEAPKDSPTQTPNGKPEGPSYGFEKAPGTYRGDAHQTLERHTTADQRDSINTFTGGSYGTIRQAGRMTEEEFKKAAGSYSSYEEYRKHAENIETAFDAVPPEKRIEGTLFRGMRVPRAVANTMLAQNDKPHLPGLGAMFSTSRRVEPAVNFLSNGSGDTEVFMVIKQRTGVAIETVSQHRTEHEVLMSGRTRCRLVNHYIVEKMGYHTNVLVLHLEEIADETDLTAQGEPKKKRAPRKKKGEGEPTPEPPKEPTP